MNITSITLIPKVSDASDIHQFRPIACCNVLHKLISRIITRRLQLVIPDVIDKAQAGFIPNRQLINNVLLTSKIIKGYERKHISVRCMIKLDSKKAYDSVEWSFLQDILIELGFPMMFVG